MISSALKSHSIVLKTYNTTDMISYVGEENVSNLPRSLFKPFIGTNSKESYFAASSDPSNSSVIWVAGEYHSMATWSTYIGGLNTGTTVLSKMAVEGK